MIVKTVGGKVVGLAFRAARLPLTTTLKSVNLATGAGLAGFRLLQRRAAQSREAQVTVTGDSSTSGAAESPPSAAEEPSTVRTAQATTDQATSEPTADAEAAIEAAAEAEAAEAAPAVESTDAPPPNPNEAAVDMLPYPHLEEPVPIVEQVLAEEGTAPPVTGHATEPSAASRDEAHGEAHLQRAEAEEIAEEVAEAFPGGDLDIATPVGTTGADVAHNPDTAEADLQQPGTEPLMDPGLIKAARKEAERASRASDPR